VIGWSRGGRHTKIHAIAGAKRSLLSLALTGAEAHDGQAAEPLINKIKKKVKKFLADKAYDSAELRETLKQPGNKPVISNRRIRKQPYSFTKKSTRINISSKMPSFASKTSDASPPATTGWQSILLHRSIW
jgi:IS5 family transposase